MKTVQFNVAGELLAITPGAKRGRDLSELAKVSSPERLVYEIEGDVDIPVGPDDLIVIRGGECFSIADGHSTLPDNPVMRKPTEATLNEQPLSAFGHGRHGKVSVAELSLWAGGGEQDVWLDLSGLADELLSPTDRIIVQSKDHFITVPREAEDRIYEVTVLFDGENKARRFPAAMTVQQAIRRSLPPRDRPQMADFEMMDHNLGDRILDPSLTLKVAGVRDGHVLTIAKKNGGGG